MNNDKPKFKREAQGRIHVNLAGKLCMVTNKFDVQWERIAVLAACGFTDSDIAKAEQITTKELDREFGDAVDVGRLKVKSAVAQTITEMALSGKNPGMSSFFAKNRMGWADKTETITEINGTQEIRIDINKVMSDKREQEILDIQKACGLDEDKPTD